MSQTRNKDNKINNYSTAIMFIRLVAKLKLNLKYLTQIFIFKIID